MALSSAGRFAILYSPRIYMFMGIIGLGPLIWKMFAMLPAEPIIVVLHHEVIFSRYHG